MADVLIVCVREDELQAKALADMFERAGFSVGGAPASDSVLRSTGAGVIVWSQASIRSRPFLDAAQRVIDAAEASAGPRSSSERARVRQCQEMSMGFPTAGQSVASQSVQFNRTISRILRIVA